MLSAAYSYFETTILVGLVVGLLSLGFCTDELSWAERGKGDLYAPNKMPNFDNILGPIVKRLPDGSVLYIERQPYLLPDFNPITRCTGNVLYEKAWLLATRDMPDGSVYAYIDTNKDGIRDIVIVWFPDNDGEYGDEYHVDLDYNGSPDMIYTDLGGTGDCDNIKPKDGEQPDEPITPGENFDSAPEAEI